MMSVLRLRVAGLWIVTPPIPARPLLTLRGADLPQSPALTLAQVDGYLEAKLHPLTAKETTHYNENGPLGEAIQEAVAIAAILDAWPVALPCAVRRLEPAANLSLCHRCVLHRPFELGAPSTREASLSEFHPVPTAAR